MVRLHGGSQQEPLVIIRINQTAAGLSGRSRAIVAFGKGLAKVHLVPARYLSEVKAGLFWHSFRRSSNSLSAALQVIGSPRPSIMRA
jgi:hypothetical protein